MRVLQLLIVLFAYLIMPIFCVAQNDVGRLREKYMQALNGSNTDEAAKIVLQLADKYRKVGDNGQALYYFGEAIERFASYHDDITLGNCYLAMADITSEAGEYSSALNHYQRAGKHYRIAKDKKAFLQAELGAINIFIKQKDAKKALGLLRESTNIAKMLSSDNLLAQCYKAYSSAYELQNDKAKALEYRKLFDELDINLRESKLREMENKMQTEKSKQYATIHEKEKALLEKDKTIAFIEDAKKRIEQKVTEEELLIEALNKEKRLKNLELQQKNSEEQIILLILAIVGVILLASIVIGVFMYRAYRDKNKANSLLELQNEEIKQQQIALKKTR